MEAVESDAIKRAFAAVTSEKNRFQQELHVAKVQLADLQAATASNSSMTDLQKRLVDANAREEGLRKQVEEQRQEIESLTRRLGAACHVFNHETDLLQMLRGLTKARGCVFPEPLVLAGPTGVGRRSLAAKLCETYPNAFKLVPVFVTVPSSADESKNVNHVTADQFKRMREQGQLAYVGSIPGGSFGVSRKGVESIQSAGKVGIIILDIMSGVAIRDTSLNAMRILIKPNNAEDLDPRLRAQGIAKAEVDKLTQECRSQLAALDAQDFDHTVINQDIDAAFVRIQQYVRGYPHLATVIRIQDNA